MKTHCGYIALVGRPNVGKSTLLNRILQQKLSITSRKPQTTRHTILGVQTLDNYQFLYVDTPGIHTNSKKTINRMMNKSAKRVLSDVDIVVFIVDSFYWQEEDEVILSLIQKTKVPCFLVINKVDKIGDKNKLLPYLDKLQDLHAFAGMIPLSAKTGVQAKELEESLKSYLPEGHHLFGEDTFTDRSTRFLCAEWLREKIFRGYGQELPYVTTVEIESFQEEDNLVRIHALIWVEKESHKRILIGNKGEKLKEIATQARLDMEKLIGKKIYLKCWCKVKTGWADNENTLKHFGYGG